MANDKLQSYYYIFFGTVYMLANYIFIYCDYLSTIYLSKNGFKLFVSGIQPDGNTLVSSVLSQCLPCSRLKERDIGRNRDRERDTEREWAVINMLQSGCISEEHWEETTGHYSTTKGLLISLLGFN